MFKDLYAHIDQKDRSRKQTLHDHLYHTALQCSSMGKDVALEKMLFYVGLLHDCGKIKFSFQQKILADSNERVDHSTYGGLLTLCFLDEVYGGLVGQGDEAFSPIIEKINEDANVLIRLNDYVHLLVYAIMSHHGPYDMVRKNEDNRYVYTSFERAEREKTRSEFKDDFEIFLAHWQSRGINLKQLFTEGFEEYIKVAEKLEALARRTGDDRNEAMCFYQGMLMRLVVSILKSADIKDTINSYETVIEEEDEASLRGLVDDFEQRVLAAYAGYGPPKDALGRGRAAIAEAILARSKTDDGGIYTLDLPTGAGKTLLSLRYGVNQMKYKKKRRFFYITSYLSVLEQNAATMKGILGHKDQVLEHHSNVVEDEEGESSRGGTDEKQDSMAAVQRQFLLGDWTSPVVLTTMVQFFNTLFKGKSANITRFKSFVDAVIVLDELQSLPTDVLYMMNLALNFMKTVMNTTVVLSTATQPTYGSASLKHRLDYGDGDQKNTAMVTVSEEDKKSFERAKVALLGKIDEEHSLDDLAAFVLSKEEQSRLVILNTKAAVRGIYDRLADFVPEKDLYYLTTNLTAADRLARIAEIKHRLEADEPICVVSTQLIEAGVDADFALVVRSLTGIDSIVQARGRCNREGKRKEAYTYVVNMDRREENIAPLKGMGERKLASRLILRDEEGEIAIEDFISPYFEKLYANLKEDGLSPVFDLLSKNPTKKDILLKSTGARPLNGGMLLEDGRVLNSFQSFKEAYDEFQLIDDRQDVAVVLCDQTEAAVNRLRDMELSSARFDPQALKEARYLIRSFARHTVPVSKKAADVCESILDGMVQVLPKEFYDKRFGLNLDYEGGTMI